MTFHHKGVIEGRGTFVELIDAFTAVIGRRHDAMLEFLAEPHSIDEMRAHRFAVPSESETVISQLAARPSTGSRGELDPATIVATTPTLIMAATRPSLTFPAWPLYTRAMAFCRSS